MVTARLSLALSLLAALPLSAAPVAKPAPRTGVFVDDCKDEKGVFLIHYKACVPEALPQSRHLGLIVYFHGINGNEEQPAAPDAFGYRADATPEERKAAVAKWMEWCGKTCGPP